MPELPEVETIVRRLNKLIPGRKIGDIWSDSPKIIKKPRDFNQFKKEIQGRKIHKISRRGKNILFYLSEGKILLVHQKMTGHFLVGRWKFKNKKWEPVEPGPLGDPVNKFLHVIFFLDNGPSPRSPRLRLVEAGRSGSGHAGGPSPRSPRRSGSGHAGGPSPRRSGSGHAGGQMLALSDLRKFAKIELWDRDEFENSKEMKGLGPEPLAKSFTFSEFKKRLDGRKGKIKQVLMDQSVVAGIGNIYSDEILWEAKIHPQKPAANLPEKELRNAYSAIKKILAKAIRLRGDSMSDYRLPGGEKGSYQEVQRVYRREGGACFRCGAIIKRIKIGGRSAHFCPKCQKL